MEPDLQADQTANIGVSRRQQEAQCAGDGRNHEQRANDSTAVLGHPIIDQSAGANPDADENTLRDAEQGSDERVEAETFDDEGGKVGDTAIGTASQPKPPTVSISRQTYIFATKPSMKNAHAL